MKLEHYFNQAQTLYFKKGAIILRPDDLTTEVFFIKRGHVRVYTLTEWGDEKLFFIYRQSEIFPLFSMFKKMPITRFYEALDDVEVQFIKKERFFSFLKSDQELLFEVNDKLVTFLEIALDRIDDLAYTNAYARLVSRLLNLVKRFGVVSGSRVIIQAPVNHRDIASSIAMTRETASREFEKLAKKGIVGYENHLIVINDLKKLKKEISAHYDKRLM
jgi:CRP/FNR family transcriptional regulator